MLVTFLARTPKIAFFFQVRSDAAHVAIASDSQRGEDRASLFPSNHREHADGEAPLRHVQELNLYS